MKPSTTTTQIETTSGRLVKRRTSANPTINSVHMSPSSHHGEVQEYFNPPDYEGTSMALPEEKESPNEETQQSVRTQSPRVSEGQHFIVNNNNYIQSPVSPPMNFTLPLEEPRCDLLPNRPAVWIIKGKDIKVSSLAASVLLSDGIITSKDLALPYSAYSPLVVDQGPTDPISGVLIATHRTVVGVLGGVADYPVAISRMATTDTTTSKREAASFALDSGKGVSRIVGTSLKAPMEFTMGVAQGFHNMPKLWGDRMVRDPEHITGVSSGFKAAGKGFGLGLWDGVTGLVTQPVKGAKEGGVGGCVGGFFKGIGGVACKPVAGAAGLPAYALKGFHAEYQKKRGMNVKTYTTAAQIQHGWEELGSSTEYERNEVIVRWYQMEAQGGQSGFKAQSM